MWSRGDSEEKPFFLLPFSPFLTSTFLCFDLCVDIGRKVSSQCWNPYYQKCNALEWLAKVDTTTPPYSSFIYVAHFKQLTKVLQNHSGARNINSTHLSFGNKIVPADEKLWVHDYICNCRRAHFHVKVETTHCWLSGSTFHNKLTLLCADSIHRGGYNGWLLKS